MHWNGTQWSEVTIPSVSANVQLRAVTALSPTDAWAVGWYVDANGTQLTLILHWDGSAWTQVDSTSPGPKYNGLQGVTAISSTDVWAVGTTGQTALALHWDGQHWISADLPDLGTKYASLDAVAGTSESDIWAVGTYKGCTDLILHWDGSTWSKDAYENGPGGKCYDAHGGFGALLVLSTTEAWAIGSVGCCGGNSPYIVHWIDGQWVPVPFDADLGGLDSLDGIDGAAADDVWAVGSTGDGFSDSKMLILHWDGTAWRQMDSPTPLRFGDGVVALSGSDAWISGDVFLHWTGE